MIKQININNLFGRYDYCIPLHSAADDMLTFITGCNGMGKTTILRILVSIYQMDWNKLVQFPFHVFEVVFDNCTITFTRDYEPRHANTETEDVNVQGREDFMLRAVYTEENKTIRCDIGRYDDNYHNIPSEIEMALMLDKPYFIDDQRMAFSYDKYGNVTNPHRLQDCVADCKARLEELRGFVNDRLSTFYTSPYMNEEVHVDGETLLSMYNKLITWGVINAKPIADINKLTPDARKVQEAMLLLYREMQHSGRIHDTYHGVCTFEELIQSYDFDHKNMLIHVGHGFRFKAAEGVPLDLVMLSSGEQQILLQTYELLLNAARESVVLIDEPETSQHVSWQMDYCQNLQKIACARNLQCIVATHLPLMFGNNFSLSVDLFELVNQEN